jgi:hypothetical protein
MVRQRTRVVLAVCCAGCVCWLCVVLAVLCWLCVVLAVCADCVLCWLCCAGCVVLAVCCAGCVLCWLCCAGCVVLAVCCAGCVLCWLCVLAVCCAGCDTNDLPPREVEESEYQAILVDDVRVHMVPRDDLGELVLHHLYSAEGRRGYMGRIEWS